MSTRRPSVVCFGEALWDITPDERMPGGAPMNVALRLASFGIETQLLTRVGDDHAGRELAGYMAANGLAIDHVQVDSHLPTGRVNIDTSNPQSVSYEIVNPSAWDHIDADAYLASGGGSDVVVFGSLAARAQASRQSLMQLLQLAQLRVFDVNLRPPFDRREMVEPLLHAANWAKLNEDEVNVIAQWIGASGSTPEVLAAIGNYFGIDVICATFGSRGAVMLRDGTAISHPGFDVPVVDTIGCGDAFLGAWLARMLAGAEPALALETACAAGAVVASASGANPLVTDAMIEAVIDSAGC